MCFIFVIIYSLNLPGQPWEASENKNSGHPFDLNCFSLLCLWLKNKEKWFCKDSPWVPLIFQVEKNCCQDNFSKFLKKKNILTKLFFFLTKKNFLYSGRVLPIFTRCHSLSVCCLCSLGCMCSHTCTLFLHLLHDLHSCVLVRVHHWLLSVWALNRQAKRSRRLQREHSVNNRLVPASWFGGRALTITYRGMEAPGLSLSLCLNRRQHVCFKNKVEKLCSLSISICPPGHLIPYQPAPV